MTFWPFNLFGGGKKRHEQIIELLKLMAKTQTELAADLIKMAEQSDKIAAEQQERFDEASDALQALRDQIASGAVQADLEAAAANLQTKLQALDDTIPDTTA